MSRMIEPRYRWLFPDPRPLDGAKLAAARDRGLSDRVAGILAARGVSGTADLDSFFGPPSAGFHDPRLLPDADRVVDRVRRARAAGDGVLVFGDFDADGITGLAVLVRALRTLGLDAAPYVPSRIAEGHGLSARAVERAVAEGRSLIVTVDCGSSSPEEVELARAAGVDVIVTDHHHVPDRAPRSIALVNPHRPDAVYPDRRLAGTGVALAVARLLLGELGGDADAALELADLATIGTVSDVAPIVGENRAIARLGLEILRHRARPGLAALLTRAGVRPETLDLETVAFQIAPRLNAAGRVGDTDDAVRLLLTDDADEAAVAADSLEGANRLRRELLRTSLEDARAALDADPTAAARPAVLVRGPWPPGIVGLIASRLAEERRRPAVVAAELDGVLRASCRSAGVVDLASALEGCSDLLIRHGGHRAAAGFEIESDRWDAFVSRFSAIAAEAAPDDPRPELALDLAMPSAQLGYDLVADLATLDPTGPGNPPPVVGVLGMTVTRVRAASGGHTQLTLRRDRDVVDAIAFGRDDLATAIHEGDRLDVAARVAVRRFGGYDSLQLEVRDVAPSGSHPDAAALLATMSA
jgi:single-stranded-DNA-specific exonuclease